MTNTISRQEPTMTESKQGVRGAGTRALLWVVLVISTVANATTSAIGLNMLLSIGFGVVTLACGVALVMHHRRGR